MTLRLAIDNMARRPDGGPLSVEVDRRDLDIGRDAYLDWSLPDPDRTVSGKHCEIKFRDGAYWLYDVSRNGTYLNGSQHRLEAPRQLRKGDRLSIGPYFISVDVREPAVESHGQAAPRPFVNDDPFAEIGDGDAALPADRRRFRQKAPGPPPPDALDFVMSLPEVRAPEPTPRTPQAREGRFSPPPWNLEPTRSDRFGATPTGGRSGAASGSAPESDALFSELAALAPAAAVSKGGDTGIAPSAIDQDRLFSDLEGLSTAPAAPASRSENAPQPLPEPEERDLVVPKPRRAAASQPPNPEASNGVDGAQILGRIAAAAGLPSSVFAGRDPSEVASEIGGVLRATNFHLYQMLNARAETKAHIRAGGRTMIQALENNPLKFNGTPEQALAAMLGPRTRAYLDPVATIDQSFGDLQKHLGATYYAMQQAVDELFEDLAPQQIDASAPAEKGLAALVSSRKAKLWDIFTERWRAKSRRSDGRLSEAFSRLFAEAYDRSSGKI